MLLDRLTEAGRRVEAGFSTYIAQADIPEPLRGAMLYSLMAGSGCGPPCCSKRAGLPGLRRIRCYRLLAQSR